MTEFRPFLTVTSAITVVINIPRWSRDKVLTSTLFLLTQAQMRRLTTIPTTLLSVFFIGSFCYGQSLADLARQTQQEKQKSAVAEKKVFTTDDLNPIAAPKPAATPAPESKKPVQPKGYDKLSTTSFTPETWTKTIKAQKDWVAFLQQQADKLKTPAKFDQKKTATDLEARKYWEERNIQQQYASQIPEQQQKLKDMQSEAQKAGMPDSVVDPQ